MNKLPFGATLRRLRGWRVLCAAGVVALCLVAAACSGSNATSAGSSPTTPAATAQASGQPSASASACASAGTKSLPNTRILLHAGAAAFAIHHWIYAPYKAGKFKRTHFGHTIDIGKAALAALFAYRELKLAITDLKYSPELCHLSGIFQRGQATMSAVGDRLKNGSWSPSDVTSATSLAGALNANHIPDVPTSIPGVS